MDHWYQCWSTTSNRYLTFPQEYAQVDPSLFDMHCHWKRARIGHQTFLLPKTVPSHSLTSMRLDARWSQEANLVKSVHVKAKKRQRRGKQDWLMLELSAVQSLPCTVHVVLHWSVTSQVDIRYKQIDPISNPLASSASISGHNGPGTGNISVSLLSSYMDTYLSPSSDRNS